MPGKGKEKNVREKKENSLQLKCLAVTTVKVVVEHNVTLHLIDAPFIPNYIWNLRKTKWVLGEILIAYPGRRWTRWILHGVKTLKDWTRKAHPLNCAAGLLRLLDIPRQKAPSQFFVLKHSLLLGILSQVFVGWRKATEMLRALLWVKYTPEIASEP